MIDVLRWVALFIALVLLYDDYHSLRRTLQNENSYKTPEEYTKQLKLAKVKFWFDIIIVVGFCIVIIYETVHYAHF